MGKRGPPRRAKPDRPGRTTLNGMQERFAHEYVIDFNATQAAIRAGYSTNRAGQTGFMLLKHRHVSALVDKLRAEQRAKAKMSADEVLEEMTRIARSRIGRVFGQDGELKGIHQLDDDAQAAIASVETRIELTGPRDDKASERVTKIRLWDKVAALRTLAQVHGLIGADVQVNLGADLASKLAAARKRKRGGQ